ncbi:PadR family transcriptional regulator [Bacillus sp. FJAT-49736]|uniref:PadR family transcriptional regulator n=1 Tax=Bacillus sp. FJAT-49736 TaxID=2833582 RepID=UPI001BC8DDC2|nr:PadR family transcriptional regulator [Bacillus sp. FJAT-49736]MBS4172222.1 PadR family transcriptional regulator [Bacillus sp. FJAT-49736]
MSLDYLILGFLSMRPATGYEIKSEFEQTLGAAVWGTISYGNLYPKLKDMEQKAWIYVLDENGERNKKVYDLTREGWLQLEKWLGVTPEYPMVKDELILKMIFWGISRPNDSKTLIEHLRSREVKTRELLKACETWRETYTWADEYGVLAFDYGEHRYRAELDWIQKTIETLANESLKPGVDKWNLSIIQQERRKIALQLWDEGTKMNDDDGTVKN